MRRIITTTIVLSLALFPALPTNTVSAAGKSTKVVDGKDDVKRYDVPADAYFPTDFPIDIKSARIRYSKDSELRVDIRFHTLKGWESVTVSMITAANDGDGFHARASRDGTTGAYGDDWRPVECDVSFRATMKAKWISVRIPSACLGNSPVLDDFQIYSEARGDMGRVIDETPYTRISSR